MVPKQCEVCGTKIGAGRKKLCSRRCIRKAWKIRNPEKVNEWQRLRFKEKVTEKLSLMPSKSCPFCEKSFHPLQDRKHAYKTFCSKACQIKSNSRRQTKRRNEILKNPSLDPVAYQKYLARKKVQDANYKAFQRGCTRDDENHISLKSWLEIKEKHGNKCAECGIIESVEVKMTVDHIHPVSKGGKNNKENIQPLCWPCNSKKQATVSVPHISQVN